MNPFTQSVFSLAYFIKRNRTRTRAFRKSGTRTFRKADLYQSSMYELKRIIDIFKGADFKYNNISFLNSSPKIPKPGIFGPKNTHFTIPQNFAIRQIRGR